MTTGAMSDPFAGPGEVRALARALDWRATSLGPVEDWSPTLRTAVRMCLESPFPLNLWCGPERVLIYNDAYRHVLGAKHPRALGRPGLEVWAEIRADLEPMFARIDAGGAPVFAEDAPFVMERRGAAAGEIAYFTFGLSAIRDEAGTIVAYLNPAAETTARVQAERALEETRRRLSAALLAGEVGTFQWDVVEDRLWGDRNFSRIFGITLDETGAAPLAAYMEAIHPDDRERITAQIRRTLETGAPYDAEYRIISATDESRPTRWVEARGRVEFDEAGRPIRFPGVVQDVTRRREAEAERARLLAEAREARREAEVANRAKSDFLASMSHELRTPLNAIGGHTQLLEMELHGPLTEAQRGTLARIDRAQRHLLGLITDILNYAKIESGRVEYVLRAVSLTELLADVLPMIEPLTEARELRVEVAVQDAPLLVWADREKLSQILINLLSNAVKFTPAGGRIAITAEPDVADRAQVLVRVRDTGIGIPAAQLEAIFEPFVQVRRRETGYAEKTEGTGLGLAISRDLARGMGAELAAESVEGEGSVFTLSMRRVLDGGDPTG
ncbi:MAG TPA: ATP-binding protein [Gemmatimonadaceae bacterium]|nr:ATP-binding protein [Gemmatimonadaceae bacterium]